MLDILLVNGASNQISFIGLVSSKNYYKQPSGVVCEKCHVGMGFEVGSWVLRE